MLSLSTLVLLLTTLQPLAGSAPQPAGSTAQDGAPTPEPGAAIAAIEAGEYSRAREILTELLAEDGLARARAALATGDPRDALAPLDEVLLLDPRNPRAWALRGRAALAAADGGHDPAFFYDDALSSFERALRLEPEPETLLGASRAALMAADFDKGLDYARRGMTALEALPRRPALEIPAERTLAEAAYRVYIGEKQAGEDAQASFAETEDALRRLLGRTPEDPWVWKQLAELYQWEGDQEAVVSTLATGLRFAPADEDLHQRYTNALREARGRQAVIEAYAAFNERHAASALGLWYQAAETVYQAIDELLATQDATSTFEEAEVLFRRCRELEESYAEACIGYELICRNGIGWCRFNNEDYAGAHAAFVSMEELKEGGLEWQLEPLLSGVQGLEFVADRYQRDTRNPESLAKAAEISDYLRRYEPESADFANNSGFLHRDAAVAIELRAMLTFLRAEEESDPAARAALLEEAQAHRDRAQAMMEKSYAAYVDAAALEPDNARFVNDTGLIMTYYLRTDVAQAERYLAQSIAAAEEQIPALREQVEKARVRATDAGSAGEDKPSSAAQEQLLELEDELDQLLEAYGDAHENFGVLYLTLTLEPERARPYLEKCVEIGPRPRVPREWVSQTLLPLCDRVAAGEVEALEAELTGRVWLHAPAAQADR